MELYQAGSFAGDNQRSMLYSTGPQNVLFSFAHDTARKTCELVAGPEGKERVKLFLAGDWQPALLEHYCDGSEPPERNLLCTNAAKNSRDRADYFAQRRSEYNILVDSGAFTAYKQGTKIDLNEYINYAFELSMKATCPVEFIALDVIAGTPEQGKTGTIPFEEKRKACEDGFNNYVTMEEAGVSCLPTFHRDDEHIDNWKWLDAICDRVIESKSKRMCLAPRVDGSPTSVKMRWLNACFLHMTARYGREVWKNFRIHGLGVSSVEIMEAYPFYSVDSTSWLWAATNCTSREFDGYGYIDTLQKTANGEDNNWARRADGRRFIPARTIQCIEHYRTREDGCNNGLEGGYWFGAQAIVADVRLQRHITELWESREVTFED